MSHLVLSLLGGFQASIDDHPLNGFQSNKVRALLAYLAVEAGRPHRRESLAVLLWPEFPETAALASLRVALSDLRQQLHDRDADPPFLLIDRETIQLNPQADCWVDVWGFEKQGERDRGQGSAIGDQESAASRSEWSSRSQSAIRNPQPEASGSLIRNLQFAISLCRGPFLDGFSIPDSAPFEEWLILNRERLSRQALRSLHTLADYYELCGENEQALVYARQQVELEPWLEEAHRQIMRLLAFSGQPSQALAHYETCKRLLADELGIEPAAETARLYETIRAGRFEEIRQGDLLPYPGEPPYRGLHFFDEPDAALFFGREAITAKLMEHIRQMAADGAGAAHPPLDEATAGKPVAPNQTRVGRDGWSIPAGSPLQTEGCCFLAVVGASGSGKSSLVHAGLVPALRQEGYALSVITPTTHPMEVIKVKGIGDKGGREGGKGRIWIIDQFEELFTLCRSEEERVEFLDCLLTPPLTSPPTPLHRWSSDAEDGDTNHRLGGVVWAGLVLVLRADFYGHCAQYPRLREALCARQEYIGPMSAAELRQAIEQPALRNGWQFEPGLVELILRDIGASEDHPPEPGALPLLEHALLETWQRRSGRTLTLRGYAEAGGVHGAIARTAESVFAHLSPEQQALARRIFLRLTELGEGTQDTRRRAPLSELTLAGEDPSPVIGLLHALAEARLITLGGGTAEVAHEALIREWPALRQWLSEDREGLRLHRHLTDSAGAWLKLEHDVGELYRGARLAQALEWAEAHPEEFNSLERDYLQASQALAQAEALARDAQRQRELDTALRIAETARRLAETERQRAEQQAQAAAEQTANAKRLRRRAWALVGALGLALLLLLVTIVLAQVANENAVQARANAQQANMEANTRATAEARAVVDMYARSTAEANALDNLQKSEAQRLAAEANRLLIEGKNQEVAALLAIRSLDLQYTFQGDEALSRASRKMYPLRTLGPVGEYVGGVAFTGNGKKILTGGEAGPQLWDAASGQLLQTFHTPERTNWVDISADGRYVSANIYSPNYVVVWDGNTGQELFRMGANLVITNTQGISITTAQGITTTSYLFDMSSDGKYLLVGHSDGSVRMWEIDAGKEIQRFPGHIGGPVSAVFSPDGRYVLTSDRGSDAQEYNRARLWNVQTGELLRVFGQFLDWPLELAFSPDMKTYMVGGYTDACFWDFESGQQIRCIRTGYLTFNATFSPDGRYVLASGVDGVAHLWEVSTGQEVQRYTRTQLISGVAFSPDGKMVATASWDGTVSIWAIDASMVQKEFTLPGSTFFSVGFSPDSYNLLTSGNRDDTVQMWDVNTGQPVVTFLYSQATKAPAQGQVFFMSWNMLFTWDATQGIGFTRYKNGFTLPQSSGLSFTISPDGKMLCFIDAQFQAYLFDAVSGELIRQLPKGTYPQACAFSPDGSRFVAGPHIFSYPGLEEQLSLDYPEGGFAMVFSPDGRKILLGGKDLILWDANTGARLQQFSGSTSALTSVALSQDGRYAAAGGFDKIVYMWESATGQEVRRLVGHTDMVGGVAFSPDGKWLATGENDGIVKLWYIDIGELKAAMCTAMPRDLTAEERVNYEIADPSPTCPKFGQTDGGMP